MSNRTALSRLVHGGDSGPEDSGVQVRPKTIRGTLQVFSGRDLDAACIATGTTNSAIAAAWGVASPTYIRTLRQSETGIQPERVEQLPKDVRRAMHMAKIATLCPPSVRGAAASFRLGEQSGKHLGIAGRVWDDGELTDDEANELASAVLDVLDAGFVVLSDARARARRGT